MPAVIPESGGACCAVVLSYSTTLLFYSSVTVSSGFSSVVTACGFSSMTSLDDWFLLKTVWFAKGLDTFAYAGSVVFVIYVTLITTLF